MPLIHTIGHSTHAIERFIELLTINGITAVADVRSMPASRFHPQFNRARLTASLKDAGIEYVFLGEELGARCHDPACLENGRVSFDRLAQSPLFRWGLDRVLAGAEKYALALMCSEKDPLSCHRTLLVARHLETRGADIRHILADGCTVPHAQVMEQLVAELKLGNSLFGDPVEEAYRIGGARISYTARDLEAKRRPS